MLGSNLFYNGQYKTDALKDFVSGPAQVTGSGTVSSTVDGIILKGVTVSCTDTKGYTTTVTSDISVGMPEFSYVVSNYSISGLPSFALIAKRPDGKRRRFRAYYQRQCLCGKYHNHRHRGTEYHGRHDGLQGTHFHRWRRNARKSGPVCAGWGLIRRRTLGESYQNRQQLCAFPGYDLRSG